MVWYGHVPIKQRSPEPVSLEEEYKALPRSQATDYTSGVWNPKDRNQAFFFGKSNQAGFHPPAFPRSEYTHPNHLSLYYFKKEK
jgi:hypothetical protein